MQTKWGTIFNIEMQNDWASKNTVYYVQLNLVAIYNMQAQLIWTPKLQTTHTGFYYQNFSFLCAFGTVHAVSKQT